MRLLRLPMALANRSVLLGLLVLSGSACIEGVPSAVDEPTSGWDFSAPPVSDVGMDAWASDMDVGYENDATFDVGVPDLDIPDMRDRDDGFDPDMGPDPNGDPDGDNIRTGDEGLGDTDGDGIPDYLDEDSDGDGLSDFKEAGDERLSTPPEDIDLDGRPNFQDVDSDGDGLLDADEGRLRLSWSKFDTDGDGADDGLEWVTGTRGDDPSENPTSIGLSAITIQGEFPASFELLPLEPRWEKVDVYFGLDDSASLSVQADSLGLNWATIADRHRCIASGIPCSADAQCQGGFCAEDGSCYDTGLLSPCFLDIQSGLGTWGGLDTFQNRVAIQPDATRTAAAFGFSGADDSLEAPLQAPACAIDHRYCLFSDSSCAAGRSTCAGFRDDALRIYFQVTDADTQCSGPRCDYFTSSVVGDLLASHAIAFSSTYALPGDDEGGGDSRSVAQSLGIASSTLDASGAPFVYSATGTDVVSVVKGALVDLATRRVRDLRLEVVDATNDDGDINGIIRSIRATEHASACVGNGVAVDLDGDGIPEAQRAPTSGALCWTLDLKPPSAKPYFQIYRGRVRVQDETRALDSHPVLIVISPDFGR